MNEVVNYKMEKSRKKKSLAILWLCAIHRRREIISQQLSLENYLRIMSTFLQAQQLCPVSSCQ